MEDYYKGLNEISKEINQQNVRKGFYESPREIGTLLMLVVSELSEALEADRADRHAEWVMYEKRLNEEPDRIFVKQQSLFQDFIKDTFEDEIADAIIRLLDLCGHLSIDIEKHINLKLEYNKNRPQKHGKNY